MAKNNSNKQTLLLIESPGKSATLSKILGENYTIRASYGHIMLLPADGKYKFGIDVDNGFKLKYTFDPLKKDKLKAIIDSAKNVKEILVASDGDTEGCVIAFHLRDALESAGVPIKRVIFNEITKAAVLKAVANPVPFDDNLYESGMARRAVDRLVGFMGSPYISTTLNEKLSAGRVQSVAVRLVVEREAEIQNFQPEEYWNIFTTLAKPKLLSEKFDAKLIKKITNKTDADIVKSDLESDQFIVTSVEAKEKKRNPYPPLTTSKLQQVAAGRYGLSVTNIMDAAQKLYEAGKITYMRTDSVRVSPEAIKDVRSWLTENNHNIPAKENFYATKDAAQNAHEAIRPSYVQETPDNIYLTDDTQKKVYRVIWERFVASQMEPALYDTVSILIKTSSGHELKAAGRTLKYAGWLEIATDQVSVKSEDEDDIQLPILKAGDNLTLVPPKVKAEQKFTQPPPRFGEAILVKELEKRGIGRPSTYATILNNISGRGYVELKSKVYHGTELGQKVVEKLKKYFKFLEYDYTANMEEQLDFIAEGKLKYEDMLDTFFKDFQKEIKNAYNDLNEKSRTDIKCSKCDINFMLIKHGCYGYYLSCSDLDCKNNISCEVDSDGKPVIKQNKQVAPGVSCPKCLKEMTRKDGKFGPYYACLDFKCGGKSKVPYEDRHCPRCNECLYLTIYNEDSVLFCIGYAKTGCNYKENLPKDKSIANPKEFNKGDGLPNNIKRILKKADKKK